MEELLIVIVIMNKQNYFFDCLTTPFKLWWNDCTLASCGLLHYHTLCISLHSLKLHGPHLRWPKTSPLSWIRPPSLNSTLLPPTTSACLPKTRSEKADQAMSWPSPQMKPVSIPTTEHDVSLCELFCCALCYLCRHLVAQSIIFSVWPACDQSSTWWRSSRRAAGSNLIPKHQSHVEGTTEELLTHGRKWICMLSLMNSVQN